jgi:hypothetical protein
MGETAKYKKHQVERGKRFWVLGSGFWVLGSGFWVLGVRD